MKLEYTWNKKKKAYKKLKTNGLDMTETRFYDRYGNSTLF